MRRTTLAVLVCLAFAAAKSTAVAGAVPAPPHSRAFGNSLTEWMVEYADWFLTNGHDGTVKRVRLLPLPSGEPVEGSGTVDDPIVLEGELDVTLSPGTPFVLPISTWSGETYLEDLGIPDDEPIAKEVFTESDVLIRLDGEPLIDSETDDLSDYYYGPEFFDEPIFYEEPTSYGSIGAIFVQGLGFTHRPLPVGEHVLTLHAEVLIEEFNIGVVFENTWHITVAP